MFKRILVLALFLLGVFWWFGQKGAEIPKGDIIKKTEVISETSEKSEEGKESEENKISEDLKAEVKTETSKAESEVKEVTKTDEKAEVKKVVPETKTAEKTSVVKDASVIKNLEKNSIKNTYQAPQRVWKPRVIKPVVKSTPVEEEIPARQTNVKTYMYEWNLDFSKKTIPSGTVNFQIKNSGRFSHEFGIESIGTIGKVMPGENKTFTVKLKPGVYEVFSKRRSDYEKGMKDVITVTE